VHEAHVVLTTNLCGSRPTTVTAAAEETKIIKQNKKKGGKKQYNNTVPFAETVVAAEVEKDQDQGHGWEDGRTNRR
jgi:hypothetical protein